MNHPEKKGWKTGVLPRRRVLQPGIYRVLLYLAYFLSGLLNLPLLAAQWPTFNRRVEGPLLKLAHSLVIRVLSREMGASG